MKKGGKGVRKVGNVLRYRGSGRAIGNERRLVAYWFESFWEKKIAKKKGRRKCEAPAVLAVVAPRAVHAAQANVASRAWRIVYRIAFLLK